jgi:hypothetical protein
MRAERAKPQRESQRKKGKDANAQRMRAERAKEQR